MSSKAYSAQVIVLRKTKLGESDLIVTLLASDGSQIRAVAKGARKPSNAFSSRLELFSIADVLICEGKNLDIIQEARLVYYDDNLRTDIERSAAAAPLAELLDKTTQLDLESPRLFDLTKAALSSIASVERTYIPSITAAHLLKSFAFLGLRPSLHMCVICGRDIDLDTCPKIVRFSHSEGGLLCSHCDPTPESLSMNTEICKWMLALLSSTFADIEGMKIDPGVSFELLQFCQTWTREHVGSSLKSLNFMFTSGLYGDQ